MRRFAQAGSRHFVFSMLSDPARMLEDYQRVIEPELAGLVG
jgi:hypothetical protein